MGKFLTRLIYEDLDGDILKVTTGFRYQVGTYLSSEVITVPVGFECDGQSYPRLGWCIDHPKGKGCKAGVIHDYLYRLNGRPVPETGITYDRKASDEIFRQALMASGVSEFKANVRYLALRLFGGIAWKQQAKRNGSLTL